MNILHPFLIILVSCLFYDSCFAAPSILTEPRQTFLITGASGELGGATAKLLAQDYDLILTGRDLVKLKNLQSFLQITYSGHYQVCTLDFTSHSSIENFKNYLNESLLSIAGVVLIPPRPHFHENTLLQDEENWLQVFQTTFTGPLAALKALLPHLAHPSKIVVIAGTTSVQLQPEYGPSCVIRRMWSTYTKALSHQLGPQGISINTLSPGVVLTDWHEQRIQREAGKNGISYQEQMEKDVSNIPMHRHAKPQEVARAIQFLLSESSDFINGINLILDGGRTLSY